VTRALLAELADLFLVESLAQADGAEAERLFKVHCEILERADAEPESSRAA
jgi:hypothetical protein